MNFTEEDKQILGDDLIEKISKPLEIIDQSHISLKLPFSVDELLKLDNIDEVQKLKLKITADTVQVLLKYPTLHSLGFLRLESNYTVTISQLTWDHSKVVMSTEDYKKSSLNLYAFSHNFLNGKRDIKFIRDKDNNYISYNDILKDIRETFSYIKEGINSQLLSKDLNKNFDSDYLNFTAVSWFGSRNINLNKNFEEFLGNEFVKKLAYTEMDESLPKHNIVSIKPKKL